MGTDNPFPLASGDGEPFPVSLPLEIDFDGPPSDKAEKALSFDNDPNCQDFDLIKIKGWPETKIDMELQCRSILHHKICTNIPVVYIRKCELRLVASVCHPELSEVKSDIENCLKQAVAAGVIAGLITENLAAATAALTAYLKSCLLAKGVKHASEIRANVKPHSQSCTEWRRKT